MKMMNYLHNFIGTKICEKCLNNAITSYIFIHHFSFTRERLDLCVTIMLENLNKIQPQANVFVQISPQIIMPPQEDIDETLLLNEDDFIDESKLKVDVLEDEFRLKSESESEPEIKPKQKHKVSLFEPIEYINNLAKESTKTYTNKKLFNGLQSSNYDVCSEFLKFNKKRKVEKKSVKFTCPLCGKHFISDYFLKRHFLKHVNKKVHCNLCDNKFNSKFYLFEHKKRVHLLNQNSYKSCKVCGRTFTNGYKLQIHEKNHRRKPCQLCNKMYATQAHYNNHIQRHAVKLKLIKQQRAQTCSFCEKECLNDNELSLHVNKIHLQIKPYSCDMCESQFYTENNLQHHKRVHSMPSKETCLFCSKTLKTRKQLVIHVRKHIGAKPFSCQVCGQAFYSAFEARKHMNTYHGGIFCCRICKATFVNKNGLKVHANRAHSII